MSVHGEAERRAAHDAAVDAWRVRVASVLRDPQAARALAFTVVAEVLAQLSGRFVGAPFDAAMTDLSALLGKAIGIQAAGGRLPCSFAWCEARARFGSCTSHEGTMAEVRGQAWALGGRLFAPRNPKSGRWSWEERAPYEAARLLQLACEGERVLCVGVMGERKCGACAGMGGLDAASDGQPARLVCSFCRGSGSQPADRPAVAPLLALLLHDAHALLTDLRAAPERVHDLVREAVEKASRDDEKGPAT